MSTKGTVTIERELLEKVLAIADEFTGRQKLWAQGRRLLGKGVRPAVIEKLDKWDATIFQVRSLLGEQEPTFDPDEKEPGEVRHRTDVTA